MNFSTRETCTHPRALSHTHAVACRRCVDYRVPFIQHTHSTSKIPHQLTLPHGPIKRNQAHRARPFAEPSRGEPSSAGSPPDSRASTLPPVVLLLVHKLFVYKQPPPTRSHGRHSLGAAIGPTHCSSGGPARCRPRIFEFSNIGQHRAVPCLCQRHQRGRGSRALFPAI